MKITRQRKVRRYLKFYKNNFQFRSPYQILIDSTFCYGALLCKLNIREQLPKYLEDVKVRLFTTSCVILEAETKKFADPQIRQRVYGAMHIVKQFNIRKCGHEKAPVTPTECFLSMIDNNNPEHFMIATLDRLLSEKCRLIPDVPLLYISYNAIHLEKPLTLNSKERKSTEVPAYQMAILKKLKTETFGEDAPPKKVRRKIKGPNPLSCKPKKKPKIIPPAMVEVAQTGKRKRCRSKKNKALPQIVNTENMDK